MGQKVNPHGLRVGVIKDWDSRWYAREDKVGDLVVEDYNIRKYLKKHPVRRRRCQDRDRACQRARFKHQHALLPPRRRHRQGRRRDREACAWKWKPSSARAVNLNIVEVRSPDLNAQLVAENIAAAAGEAYLLPPRHEEGHAAAPPVWAPRASRSPAAAVWAALRSPAARATTRAPSPCRPSAPTSTTALPRPTPPTAASA